MQLKQTFTIGAILLTSIPVLIGSLILYSVTTTSSHEALQNSAQNNLVAIRDLTKGRIEDYFSHIRNQVLTLSNDQMVIDALQSFNAGFQNYKQEIDDDDSINKNSQLGEYYTSDFSTEYKRLNSGQQPDANSWFSQLDDSAIALQYDFIRANANPLGEKYKLHNLKNASSYAKQHSLYHHIFLDYLEKFEYYDIFLVDSKSGNIVYSVFKELDFATSLIDGPFAKTGIGALFREANKANNNNFVALEDFAAYPPSYESPASFIASPIFSGNEKIGVLIFQMPIGKINQVMTHDNNWQHVGLGESGETYLVAADAMMRSTSRFLLEDKVNYLKAISKSGVAKNTVDMIDAKNTSISFQPINTEGSRDALAGKTGFKIFPDYRDVPVLSAYAPVLIDGLDWVILAEIDEEEAFRPANELSSRLIVITSGITVILIILAAGVGFYFAGRVSNPIINFSKVISEIERDSDLTRSIDIQSKDELGDAASAFNSMLRTFQSSIHHVSDATSKVTETANKTSTITDQTSQAVQVQMQETNDLAIAMTQMSATVTEVATNVSKTAEASADVNIQTTAGLQAMNDTISQINELAEEVESTASVLVQVEDNSVNIGSVIDVIKSIAEQTNLLALNAAIEAARAGEQGRGFAVVADEVRNLASKTQASTEEISQMIEKLQSASQRAVSVMELSKEKANNATEQAANTGEALAAISEAIARINDMSGQIASAAEQQTVVADECSQNIDRISTMTEQTAAGAQETSAAGGDLTQLASELQDLVKQFKV
ncbi:MAG: HAMP domain-containing protein [Gammaproteobacteria bacterium]|nr:HAMP domain-containing protein [Gammaproteobacteria bacterium]